MIPRFPRRAAAAILLLGLVLAACGTGSQTGSGGGPEQAAKPTPLESITLAASKTSEAKSAKLAITIKSDAADADETMTAEGVADFASGKMRMTGASAEGTLEMLFDGKAFYMRLEGEELPGGKA
jgi:hypothetical protein